MVNLILNKYSRLLLHLSQRHYINWTMCIFNSLIQCNNKCCILLLILLPKTYLLSAYCTPLLSTIIIINRFRFCLIALRCVTEATTCCCTDQKSTMSEKDDATKTRGGGRKKRVVEVDETEKDGTIAKYSRIAKKISVKVFSFLHFSEIATL